MKYYKSDNRKIFYATKYKEQGGRCALCGDKERLVIDHNHITGMMRALLCYKHNLALGLFSDSPELLTRAIEYLEQHSGSCYVKFDNPIKIGEAKQQEQLLEEELLNDVCFSSDRARARVLAEKLNISESTAQSRIRRARIKRLTNS